MILNNLKTKFFYDEVYRVGFVFLINVSSDAQVEKILKKKFPASYRYWKEAKKLGSVSIEDCGGKNVQTLHRQFILVQKPKFKVSEAQIIACLAHECLHAVMDVLAKRGADYSHNMNNEHYTYYLEALMREALEK